MAKKVFDNFTGEGLKKAQDFILKNLEKNLNTKNLTIIKSNSEVNEFKITLNKLLSLDKNVICVSDTYEDLHRYSKWVQSEFTNIKSEQIKIIKSVREIVKELCHNNIKDSKFYDDLLEEIDFINNEALDYSFLSDKLGITEDEFKDIIDDYQKQFVELNNDPKYFKVVFITPSMLLSSKLDMFVTKFNDSFTLIFNSNENFYLGQSINLNNYKSQIKTSIFETEVRKYQDYNKFIHKIKNNISDIIIENNIGSKTDEIRFKLDNTDIQERYKVVVQDKPIQEHQYKQNPFQDILIEVVEFNLSLIRNSEKLDKLENRFSQIKNYSKYKNHCIVGLNYKIFLNFFNDLYWEVIQVFKDIRKLLMGFPNQLDRMINIRILYEHQKFFVNLFKRNDLTYDFKELETIDFSLLIRLNEFANFGDVIVINKYFDEYLFNLINQKVFLLPQLINYQLDLTTLNAFNNYNLLELVLINKNILVFCKSKNISQDSIFGKGSSFWKKEGGYLEVKENLMKKLLSSSISISLITHKEQVDKFKDSYSFEWATHNNEKYINYFGSKNIQRAIKDTKVLFILGNNHYGSNQYEKNSYFYSENLPLEVLNQFSFSFLDKNFSFLKFDIENGFDNKIKKYFFNPYEHIVEKSLESNTEWALNQFKDNTFPSRAGVEQIVVIYGKVPKDLKEQITLVEHSLKPEILYLLILKILSPNEQEQQDHEYFYFSEFNPLDKQLNDNKGIKDKINSALRVEFPNLKKITGRQEEYYIEFSIRVKKSILFAELGKPRVRKPKLKK